MDVILVMAISASKAKGVTVSRRSYLASLLGIFLVVMGLGFARTSRGESDEFDNRVLRYMRQGIRSLYVEDLEEFDRKIFYGALHGMMSVLDPHSAFMTPEQFEELSIDTEGHFGGLGIVIEKPLGEYGPLIVVTPFIGTPASKAGLQPGDRIIEIEGKPTNGMTLFKCVSQLRGKVGTPVNIKIQHAPTTRKNAINAGSVLQGCRLISIDGNAMEGRNITEILDLLRDKQGSPVQVTVVPEMLAAPEDVRIVRGDIKVPVVQFARVVDKKNGIGYVQLARFQANAAIKLEEAIDELMAKGAKSVVIDLRGNGGGLLSTAISAAGLFLKRGSTIVSTKGRSTREKIHRAPRDGVYSDMPVAILIDGSSASASEILAAALRDNSRAIIVGTRSYGKGSVQQLYPLELGVDEETGEKRVGAMKITIEKYYTPSGTSIQREPDKETWGVEPDIEVELSTEDYIELRKQWEKDRVAEQEDNRDEHFSSESRTQDPSLNRAVEILRAIMVMQVK